MSQGALEFQYGALATLACIAALLFARYYRKTGDRLFVFMAATFLFFAANWAVLVDHDGDEHAWFIYLPRLFGFLILLAGIYDKNRRAAAAARDDQRAQVASSHSSSK